MNEDDLLPSLWTSLSTVVATVLIREICLLTSFGVLLITPEEQGLQRKRLQFIARDIPPKVLFALFLVFLLFVLMKAKKTFPSRFTVQKIAFFCNFLFVVFFQVCFCHFFDSFSFAFCLDFCFG